MVMLSINKAVIACALLLSPSYSHANWIDPDTPIAAHYTKPRQGPPPPTAKEHTNAKETTSKLHNRVPTPSPSAKPTTSPTEYPTLSPTASGTKNKSDDSFYKLIFSDEFNTDGRQFQDGADPKWTALDKNDYTNGALHYYSPENAYTANGDLVIETKAESHEYIGFNDTSRKNEMAEKHFQSAMLQTWNKFCFTGGIIEAEIQLPGKQDVGGLWPAFWLLGNVARHTYVGSTNHVWPWSSNVCTEKSMHAQRISGCMKAQHYGLHAGVGRGAPEIDIFEVQAGPTKAHHGPYYEMKVGQPFMSASYQVAPGRPNNRPGGGYWPGPGQWYEGLRGGENTSLNILFYGNYNHFRGDPDEKDYWSDAVSYNHQLDERHFVDKFKYRLEWELPDENSDGYIRWFINDHFVSEINGTGIVNAGVGKDSRVALVLTMPDALHLICIQ
jgi:beta-glucanase (GH16 family)